MSVSRKIRFEVFKRDGFKCGYCGRTPPDIILEVDHINPRSKGGDDDINNLIASCFDCNRGKLATPLSRIPPTLLDNIQVLKEKEDQLRNYNSFLKKIRLRENKWIEKIDDIYNKTFPEWRLSEEFKHGTVRRFIRALSLEEVREAMEIACLRKRGEQNNCIKYFCGICWNKINALS